MVRGSVKRVRHENMLILLSILFVFVMSSRVFAQAAANPATQGNVLEEKQIVEINKSLKGAIEQNQSLENQNRQLQNEIERLRAESSQASMQLEDLKKERGELSESIKKVRGANREYSQKIKDLESSVQELEAKKQDYDEKIKQAEAEAAQQQQQQHDDDDLSFSSTANQDVLNKEGKAVDLLSKIDAFNEQDQRLKSDAAKAHYNMGNIYFQKGEFELAAREYYQAMTLMPDDPDAHYNLAFVSGEYLHDFKTALKHYEIYLYLNPESKDKHLVREKIIHAKLVLRNTVDSPLEKEEKDTSW